MHGEASFVMADVAVLHVDLTRVPRSVGALAARYPRVINGAVHDISKRRVSRLRLRLGDGYTGPVIVKTNRNCGGIPDRESALRRWAERPRWLRRAAHSWHKRAPAWLSGTDLTAAYPTYPSRAAVPLFDRMSPRLVVERLMEEKRDAAFIVRRWWFFGAAEHHYLEALRDPGARLAGDNVIARESLGEVPAEIRAERQRLQFDYGKFDYAIVDGRPVLYDANPTPGGMRLVPHSITPEVVNGFARALDAFIPRG